MQCSFNEPRGTPACLVCGHARFVPEFGVLLRCAHCSFVTAQLDPSVEIPRLYKGDYFAGGEYLDYAADEALFRRNFRRRLHAVLRRRTAGRLLEIGAAYGFFLDLARQHFEVVGFELNPAAAAHGRERLGLDVRTTDFLQADDASLGGPIDVCVMWDVIEHLERPDLYLKHVHRLSSPGALLHITTGDIGSPLARFRGRRWRMIHPPTHLHYFDRRTLSRLLAACGFRILHISSEGVSRSVRQVLYSIIALGLHRPGWYHRLAAHIPADWGFTLNTRDIMHVIAEHVET